MSYRTYHPLLGLIINSSSRKFHFTFQTSSSNKGSIRSYRMYRGMVYMYFHKAAGHLFGKALFLSHVVGIGQVTRHQKVVRCLTTECLSQRQKSDISHIFHIVPYEMYLYWRNVEVCGLRAITFFSTAFHINQSACVCLLYGYIARFRNVIFWVLIPQECICRLIAYHKRYVSFVIWHSHSMQCDCEVLSYGN